MLIELIRHGETSLQKERRYQGATDAPLSDSGRKKLRPADNCPAQVFVSPLRRARETAAILFPQAEQIVVPDLREMNFGAFEGRSYREMENDPDYRAWVDGMCLGECPGGESKRIFCNRVCKAFSALVAQAEANKKPRLTIVAHGGTQMAVLERYAHEEKPYWEWQLPSGQGYLLEAHDWSRNLQLHVMRITAYTAGKW